MREHLREECKDDPVSEPLRIIGVARRKKSLKGKVAGDDEAGEVGQELTTKVEDDEKQVQSDEPESRVRLGDRGTLLEVVEHRVLGELYWAKIRSMSVRASHHTKKIDDLLDFSMTRRGLASSAACAERRLSRARKRGFDNYLRTSTSPQNQEGYAAGTTDAVIKSLA